MAAIYDVELMPETLQAFEAYARAIEHEWEAMDTLWADSERKRTKRIAQGEILAQLCSGRDPIRVPHGLVHDWVGAAFAPGATLKQTLALIQNYDNHKDVYQPEVVDSKLLERTGDDFRIYLRLLKTKILSVVMDTEHEVHYSSAGERRRRCKSRSTRVAEVREPGTPEETVLAPDTGFGFLWRINTYWSFDERDGGTVLECRAISLSRDIPLLLRPIIRPIVRSLPEESLIKTLAQTRAGLQ